MLVRVTPLIPAPALGANVWLKLENLQRTGSFKLRGAYRRLCTLNAEQRSRGVVAASAGSHGLGLALAGQALEIAVSVFVPTTSPQVKRSGIAALGAQVTVLGGGYDEAEAAARDHAAATGAYYVSAFADPEVIAGNGGDLGRELALQCSGLSRVIGPVGGGGLLGGIAAQLTTRGIDVVGVQPVNNCAMHDSLHLGRALTSYDGLPTLAEGCEGAVAEITYDLFHSHNIAISLVSEAAIRRAMAFAYRTLGQIVEPSGAVALAGLREGVVSAASDGATVVILSGGNVDPTLFEQVLGDPP